MGELELQVKRIQDKLQQLLRQRETLLKENERLKTALQACQAEHRGHVQKLEQLQQQVEILKTIKGGEMNEAEKKTLEKRISRYIREIDRCIALLGE